MSIGVIIQARMNSKRFPKKVLKMIGKRTLLEHIIYRLSFLKTKVKIIIATSNTIVDNNIEEFCLQHKVDCFRGDEENVLSRYYDCAIKYNFSHIVRLTGDNPFTDIEELDNLIELHVTSKADYSRSFSSLPKGVGAEIFTFEALEKSYILGKKENHKEHVNEYIEENEDKFKIEELKVNIEKNRPDISLTVDTLDDYKKACFIVKNSKKEYISTIEAIKLCLQFV